MSVYFSPTVAFSSLPLLINVQDIEHPEVRNLNETIGGKGSSKGSRELSATLCRGLGLISLLISGLPSQSSPTIMNLIDYNVGNCVKQDSDTTAESRCCDQEWVKGSSRTTRIIL